MAEQITSGVQTASASLSARKRHERWRGVSSQNRWERGGR
jgi:hypothetical protein